MAEPDPEKDARDQRLDELKEAYESLYKQEVRRAEVEEDYLRKLKSRSSSQSLAKKTAATNKLLLIQDINSFLAGT